jgi:hypothetical protein
MQGDAMSGHERLAILGTGNIGRAMAAGLEKAGVFRPRDILANGAYTNVGVQDRFGRRGDPRHGRQSGARCLRRGNRNTKQQVTSKK